MAITLWELWSDLSWKDAASSTEGITRSSVDYLRKRKSKHSRDPLRIWINENTFVDSFFFRFDLFLSHCFSLLSAFFFFWWWYDGDYDWWWWGWWIVFVEWLIDGRLLHLISNRDHCQRSSPSHISKIPQVGYEPAQNLS